MKESYPTNWYTADAKSLVYTSLCLQLAFPVKHSFPDPIPADEFYIVDKNLKVNIYLIVKKLAWEILLSNINFFIIRDYFINEFIGKYYTIIPSLIEKKIKQKRN